jgi:two-component system phosphate regulon sensor histidine kinase PhoR
MPSRFIRILIFVGGFVVLSTVLSQTYWLMKTWDLKDQEFDQTVRIALRQVAEEISTFNNTDLPKSNLIQRRSSNIYAVNINSAIDANVLEDYLIQLFEQYALKTDFEYALYDCYSDNLVYGNYCQMEESTTTFKHSENLPKFDDLVYYFVVKFPSRESYLLNNMFTSVVFSAIAAMAVLFFLYTMYVIIKQKKLSELQKDFINNMTHEFKTPISSIKIAAEVLASGDGVKNNQRLSRYTDIIKQQNQRLNDQVEKVLNIAKIETDRFSLNKTQFNPHTIISEIIKNEAVKLEDGEITYYPPEREFKIIGDQLHFTNVVSNIIDNATKYSKENKPKIKVKVLESEKSIILKIIDNGIGISKENQKKIFEKFYRVSTGNVHNVKGFGLGLFYVKNICKAHGWDILIDSEKNKGTSVEIIIPKQTK